MPTFNATNNTYTFTLKPGLKWSDGTPIDANTFAYSINRSLNPCTASLVTYYMFPIKDAQAFSTETCTSSGTVAGKIQTLIGDSLNVPDSHTLVIILGAPAPYFLQAICYPTAFAQPKQLINKYGSKNWTSHLTANGGFGGNLYKVSAWDHKGNVDLVRNSTFWGTPARLTQINFKVYQTVNSEYADYQAGSLDLGIAPAAEYKQSRKRTDFHEQPSLAISYYQPNWTKAPFNNVDVRQAFDLALDKTVLADRVNQGSVTATNHIVPEGMYGYNSDLTGPDGTNTLAGDPTKAAQLMQTYANANCGGKFSGCPPVTLVDANDPQIVIADQAAVQMWESAFPGYPIKTSFIDFNTELSLIGSANAPQIWGIGWVADYPDPQDWLSLQFGPASINNTGSVDVPQASDLMAEADVNLNPSSRVTQCNQAEQLLVTDGAWIPLNQQKRYYNVPTYVHKLQFSGLGTIPLASWESIYLTNT
jgi:peptide/nickel transport system substrate-binding protein/oligopeptide transport system substrate-binding protein